jgi:uroporphyrinogen decarboxylase-like protein
VTSKERILTAMRGERPDRVPLTIYDWMLPRGTTERLLREAGVGLIPRLPPFRVCHRAVEVISHEYFENGRKRVRRTLRTPVGEASQILEPESAYGTSTWIQEHFIKSPEDYRVLEFYYNDMLFQDNNDAFREAQRRVGDDGLVFARIPRTPLQEMLYQLMGLDRFAADYHERRELFDSLFAIMTKRYGEIYEFAAASPAEVVWCADNIYTDMIGPERFQRYIAPEYAKVSARIKGTDKLLAVHMDGTLRSLSAEIGAAECHIIEAMTPPPMGDFSVREARAAWPKKALWLNFTSCMHIQRPDVIAEHTRSLLAEAGTTRAFAIGVTEDAPVAALEASLGVIARVLKEHGPGP